MLSASAALTAISPAARGTRPAVVVYSPARPGSARSTSHHDAAIERSAIRNRGAADHDVVCRIRSPVGVTAVSLRSTSAIDTAGELRAAAVPSSTPDDCSPSGDCSTVDPAARTNACARVPSSTAIRSSGSRETVR